MCVRIGAAALAAVCAVAHPALAQDAPPLPPAAKFYDWTGVFVGAHVAYGSATVSDSVPGIGSTPATTTSQSVTGVLAGGQLGGNFQFGHIVVGAEADGDWSSLSGTSSTGGNFKIPWLATARLRVGAAYDRIWYYATGGAATVNYTPATVPGAIPTADSSRRTAWVAGAGSESAINRNLILQFEVLYLQLFASTNTVVPATTSSERVYEIIVRAGLSYKFNWSD